MKKKLIIKRSIQSMALVFGILNLIAYNQAYHFTHFSYEANGYHILYPYSGREWEDTVNNFLN